jgi:N-carbamoylputrescine amidase
MDSKIIKAGLIQHACGEDCTTNLATTMDGIESAAGQGAQLVLLQELHRNMYFCQREDEQYFELAEDIPGETTEVMGALAGKLGIIIVASLFERRAAGIYHNTAVVLDADGTLAGRYRKMHIPDDPGYYEKFYFTPGDLGFTPISTSLGKLGVLVCWDQWYPEAARLMVLAGADLLLYPTAIGWDKHDSADVQSYQLDAWLTIQRSHAISNCLPLLACNRTGFEPDPGAPSGGIHFWGNSCIVGAQGEVLAQAGSDKAEVIVANIDLSHSEQLRQTWPFLRDRRIDAYADLLKRYDHLNPTGS